MVANNLHSVPCGSVVAGADLIRRGLECPSGTHARACRCAQGSLSSSIC